MTAGGRPPLARAASATEEQWATASLCAGWSVRDVFGHITATAKQTIETQAFRRRPP